MARVVYGSGRFPREVAVPWPDEDTPWWQDPVWVALLLFLLAVHAFVLCRFHP